jgi:long-chain acyl-CoA synthetase
MSDNSSKYITEGRILLKRGTENASEVRFMCPVEGVSMCVQPAASMWVRPTASSWSAVTWGEFLDKSSRLALYLSGMGVGRDAKVAIYARTRVEWAFFGMAIHACRAVFVPVYFSSAPAQARHVINHSDAEALVTEAELLPNVLAVWDDLIKVRRVIVMGIQNEYALIEAVEMYNEGMASTGRAIIKPSHVVSKVVLFEDALAEGGRLHEADPEGFERMVQTVEPGDTAAIIYTSGTTGDPKGVALSLENLYTNAEDWINVLGGLIPEVRVDLLWLPLSHIFGWGELGLGNTLGFTTYLTTPPEALGLMPVVRPTVFMSVPAYWEKMYMNAKAFSENRTAQLARLAEITGGRLKFCLSGGAGLKREVKEFFHEAGLLIIEGYGLTECSPTLTMNRGGDFDFDSVGKPFPRVELRLAEDGEILARGPNVFKGYYKNPEATKEVFTPDGWLLTGDLGRFNDGGFLQITGRKKEIIVTSGGKNVSPQQIEAMFRDDPLIEHIVLYGSERRYLTALVTLKEEAAVALAKRKGLINGGLGEVIKSAEIIDAVRASIDEVNKGLSQVEKIKKVYIHDGRLSIAAGHLTSTLKLRRAAVWKDFKERLDGLYED